MTNWTDIETHRRRLREQDLASRIERERGAGHLDARERAVILRDIDAEVQIRELTRVEAADALGLAHGALYDGRVPTIVLHAVLATLRTMAHRP